MKTPRDRALSLLNELFAYAMGGGFGAAQTRDLARAVDALIDAARETEAGHQHAPQVGSLELSIGRLLYLARYLNDPADPNLPYLDGQVRLIWRAAELGPAESGRLSIEPLAERLRKAGAIDMLITGRGLLEAARPLVPPDSTNTEFVRGVVELACEALGLSTDDYRVQVEDVIRTGLPWHGVLRPPALYHAQEGLNVGQGYHPAPSGAGVGQDGDRPRTSRARPEPSLRFMIRMARRSQNGQCGNWAMGQARLICDIAGLPHDQHADRIADLITAPPATAECKWCHREIRRDDLSAWTDTTGRRFCLHHGGYSVDRAVHVPEPCTITETEQS